jgi:predicted DCC family thiol-disulfide oxidoreductase YuxK
MADVATTSFAQHSPSHSILLYDGVCRLCNRLNQFVLRHDPEGLFRFASLQSPLAEGILNRHGFNTRDLDTVYVVLNYNRANESLLSRSDAIASVLGQLGGIWRLAGILIGWLPRWFRDWVYRVVARNRYRIFGRSDMCILPSPENRSRFLDV